MLVFSAPCARTRAARRSSSSRASCSAAPTKCRVLNNGQAHVTCHALHPRSSKHNCACVERWPSLTERAICARGEDLEWSMALALGGICYRTGEDLEWSMALALGGIC